MIALGDRSLYPQLKATAYLAYAATAPVSSNVQAAVMRVLDAYAERGNVAFLEWLEQRERLRQKLAQLVGGNAADVALISGTTRGISDLALCFPWRAGERLVLFEGEFPANVSPWLRAAELFGLQVDFVPMQRSVEDEASFLEPLLRHVDETGLGHVSEIADGDAPHTPRGCPFQAWSLSELLRLELDVLA